MRLGELTAASWSLTALVPFGMPWPVAVAVALSGPAAYSWWRYLDHVERLAAINKTPAHQVPEVMGTITGHGANHLDQRQPPAAQRQEEKVRMDVIAWTNGSPRPSGAGYGVRLTIQDRDRYFDHDWDAVRIELDEHEVVTVPLSASFWGRCAELRNAAIGRWLIRHGLGSWPPGRPPTVRLQHIDDNQFQLLK